MTALVTWTDRIVCMVNLQQRFIFIHRRCRRRYGGMLSAKSVPVGRRHPTITVDHVARMAALRVIVTDLLGQPAGDPMKRQVACSSGPTSRSRESSCCLSGRGRRATVRRRSLRCGSPLSILIWCAAARLDVVLSADSLSSDIHRAHELMLNISWPSLARAPAT